ncbi:hypothetical protein [Nonomuraea sp. NPDC005730]|uniref:hypothetical protein n=1 Tax=Nonomuraea sp. NPDC005730 TaxID=3157055 RepID=UPI0033CD804F
MSISYAPISAKLGHPAMIRAASVGFGDGDVGRRTGGAAGEKHAPQQRPASGSAATGEERGYGGGDDGAVDGRRPGEATLDLSHVRADNAVADSFHASLKRETLKGAPGWPDARTARLAGFGGITRYNPVRRHLKSVSTFMAETPRLCPPPQRPPEQPALDYAELSCVPPGQPERLAWKYVTQSREGQIKTSRRAELSAYSEPVSTISRLLANSGQAPILYAAGPRPSRGGVGGHVVVFLPDAAGGTKWRRLENAVRMWPWLEGDFPPAIKFHGDKQRVTASIIDWRDHMAIPAVANPGHHRQLRDLQAQPWFGSSSRVFLTGASAGIRG